MRASLLIAAAACSAFAQQFEVASIKPAAPGARGMGFQSMPGGSIRMKNVTLRLLVTYAWDIRDHQLQGGPAWLDTEHYDILAKPESEIPRTPEGSAKTKRLVQTMLVERFGLGYHRETKEMPVYALVTAKNGPKLADSPPDTQNSMMLGRGTLEGKHMKTSDLARMLSDQLGRTVVDKTGLTGDYDFTMKWVPDLGETTGPKGLPQEPPKEVVQAPDGPSLFTAIQEQLGLKLEGRKGPVEMFVIDRAEKPSEN
jgi:uncharacterized protein (TIGR03435 family)